MQSREIRVVKNVLWSTMKKGKKSSTSKKAKVVLKTVCAVVIVVVPCGVFR